MSDYITTLENSRDYWQERFRESKREIERLVKLLEEERTDDT